MPTLTDEDIDLYYNQLKKQWSVVEKDGIKRLEKSFKFKDFAEALAFTNKVGELAEKEGHHPDILTEWGSVTVSWWTHKIKGLSKNDFIMAAKTDAVY
jgi:4a-hydroxytetrahydrobiopterin dehydratase